MRRKINISLVAVAFFAIVATMFFLTVAFNNLYTGQVMKDLKLMAGFVSEYGIQISMGEGQFSHEELRVTLLDREGNVLSDTAANAAEMENHGNRPEVMEALKSGEGEAVRRSDTLQKNTYYYAIRLQNGSILRISREADSIFRYLETIVPSLLLIFICMFIASIGIAHFLTQNLIAPIKRLAANLDGNWEKPYYEELEPFIQRIREQHLDLLKSAKIRQEFTANVTHELKTPLTSISGYAELIETGMASEEDTARFAGGIHKSANRLLTLINDIIRLSELDTGEEVFVTESLNLYQLAGVCVEMLEPNAEKHKVSIRMQGQDCMIQGNRMMIEELLYNLCDNGIRYNNENGTVLVDVRPEGEHVVLTVSDTGIGIPKEHQERIFERFYRVDKSRSKSTGGTGLGLAIVKHILEKHHAKLEVDSDTGKGTTMRITFESRKEKTEGKS